MSPKTFVTVIASLLIAVSAVTIVFYVVRLGFGDIQQQMIRFGLTCALSVSLIRGWHPGRWIAVALIGLASITAVGLVVKLLPTGSPGLGMLVMAVIYIGCVVGLLTPFAGRHFKSGNSSEKNCPVPCTTPNHSEESE